MYHFPNITAKLCYFNYMHKTGPYLLASLMIIIGLSSGLSLAKIDFDTYRPPSSSYHCKKLTSERSEQLKVKQELTSLLERNSYLMKNTPRERETTYRKLVFLRGEIKFKLEKHILKLKSVEQKIVRHGCPSILSTNS